MLSSFSVPPLDPDSSLTEKLRQYSGGDPEMEGVILEEILPKLRRIASASLKRERYVEPLSTTELIHEVWMKKLRNGGWQIRNREHFYSLAARAMRQVLVDVARSRQAAIRGDGDTPLSLTELREGLQPSAPGPEEIIEIGLLMDRLEKKDPMKARVVDLHYFAGFTLEEAAQITDLTPRQVRHLWEGGRDWLKDRIEG